MRKKRNRCINWKPDILMFKPAWIKRCNLEEIIIELDEFESLKLSEIENLNMIQGAEKMWISAATFNRILKSAHSKIANAIIYWKIIKLKDIQ